MTASQVRNEWRRLVTTSLVLVTLLTLMNRVVFHDSWPKAAFTGLMVSLGFGLGWWLRRIRSHTRRQE